MLFRFAVDTMADTVSIIRLTDRFEVSWITLQSLCLIVSREYLLYWNWLSCLSPAWWSIVLQTHYHVECRNYLER